MPELVEAIVPGGLGKTIVWLWQKSRRPLFGIDGAIQADTSTQTTMFVVAARGRENLKRWRRTTRNVDVATGEVKLAHAALNAIIKEMNDGRV